ncbi:hypothetical protein ANO14919_008140 [Xylariales sp. No.14919]|nr:hypothetical protein F5X98DRAFT_325006 [Xylaria grammica]GAW11468.1 hypothetical protein ANO14919_008140 [Xylariales sp. No.14919]
MAPTQPENAQAASAVNKEQRQSEREEMQEISLQPMTSQPMDPERPHAEPQMNLRGGERSSLCPGRFCFCVPCPLPCDFCII